MRETIASEIGITNSNSLYDEQLLDFYHQGKYLLGAHLLDNKLIYSYV